MVEMTVQDFGGRLPSRSKRLLPENFSQEAYNTKLISGELRGLRAPSNVHTFTPGTDPARVWRVRRQDNPATSYWVTSDYSNAELVKCPLVEDAYDRWYLFEPGQPAQVLTTDDMAAATGPWNLAFDYPTTAPTLVPTVNNAENVRDVVYVYTYVTSWGEESPPSNSQTVSVDDAGSVVVSNFYTPVPAIAGRTYDKVRIYRSVTTGFQGGLFFVAEINYGTASYNDTLNDATVSLNEQLPSANWAAPVDGMWGARVHPSGALVAVKDRTVYFSEPYRPHVWPETYKLAVADDIVGIEVFEQNVGVFTKGRPVLIYGSTPSQTGLLKFGFPEPCVAYGSIIGSPEGAYYASHQGIVQFTATGPTNITRHVIAKEEWETQYLDDRMSAARFGTQYIAAERPGEGFILDTQEARIALTDFLFGSAVPVVSFSEDYYTGDIYLVAGDDVFLWDDSAAEEIDYIWKSKQQMLARPVNMGAIMVHLETRANQYVPSTPLDTPPFPPEYVETEPEWIGMDKKTQVLVEVFMNDERVLAAAASDREQVRIPSGRKGDAFEVRITGQCRVYSVALTETGRGQASAG